LTKANQTFLVDAFVFPGNSGGPVVSKPEALSIEGTKSQNAAYLIGIVQSYVPYQDLAVSLQTKRPRVVFEENSGLAAVHPVDLIEETIQIYLKLRADKEERAKA
jgi:S1-C subfamily serine protease